MSVCGAASIYGEGRVAFRHFIRIFALAAIALLLTAGDAPAQVAANQLCNMAGYGAGCIGAVAPVASPHGAGMAAANMRGSMGPAMVGVGIGIGLAAIAADAYITHQEQLQAEQQAIQRRQQMEEEAEREEQARQQQQAAFNQNNNTLLNSLEGSDNLPQTAGQTANVGPAITTRGPTYSVPDAPQTDLQPPQAIISADGAQPIGGAGVTNPGPPPSSASGTGTATNGSVTANGMLQNGQVGGSDEAMSMQARVGFDTPGGGVGVQAPQFSSAPSMTGSAVAPGGQTNFFGIGGATGGLANGASAASGLASAPGEPILEKPACVPLSELKRRVAGFQQALARMDQSAKLDDSERKQWEKETEDAVQRSVERGLDTAAKLFIDNLNDRLDQHVKDADTEIQSALDKLINENPGSDRRQQLHLAIRSLEKMKSSLVEDIGRDRVVVQHLKDLEETLDAHGYAAEHSEDWEKGLKGCYKLLNMTLNDPWFKSLPLGRFADWAQNIEETSLDLSSEYASYRRLNQLNENADDYLKAVNQLKAKMEATFKQIQQTEQAMATDPTAGTCAQTAAN